MLESLYEEAIKKKGTIQEQIEDYEHKDLDLSGYWKEKTIPLPLEDHVIAAGDGSKNQKRFMSFYLYAVAAETLIYNPKNEPKLETLELTDIDTLPHQRYLDERLSNFMNLFELKNAIQALEENEIDYYLYDGSIYGDLIRLFPSQHNIPKNVREQIADKIYLQIKDAVNENDTNIISKGLWDDIDLEEDLQNFEVDIFLENIEKSLLLKRLLLKKEKIVSISKTSSSKEFFNSNVPDIALLNGYSTGEGYSILRTRSVSQDVRPNFLIGNDFFQSLEFTIFYARLEPNKNVLKFELPYKATEEECLKIIIDLKKDAIGGYPYLLFKAHHDVVIQNKDMDSISSIVNIIERQGREML